MQQYKNFCTLTTIRPPKDRAIGDPVTGPLGDTVTIRRSGMKNGRRTTAVLTFARRSELHEAVKKVAPLRHPGATLDLPAVVDRQI